MVKRTLKLVTLALLMFIGGNSIAQNQWSEDDVVMIDGEYLVPAAYCDGIFYSIKDKHILKIYNKNFECIKTINFNIPGQDNGMEIYCLTKGIFTSSNNYEFIVRYWYYDDDGYYDKAEIYNENVEMLYSFSNAERINGSFYIIGNKLICNLTEETNDKYHRYTKILTLAHSINNQSSAGLYIQQWQNSSCKTKCYIGIQHTRSDATNADC